MRNLVCMLPWESSLESRCAVPRFLTCTSSCYINTSIKSNTITSPITTDPLQVEL